MKQKWRDSANSLNRQSKMPRQTNAKVNSVKFSINSSANTFRLFAGLEFSFGLGYGANSFFSQHSWRYIATRSKQLAISGPYKQPGTEN